MINVSKKLVEGRQHHRSAHAENEVTKRGNLRAGSGGIMSEDGKIAGDCHRLAHLRQLGVELEVPDDSTLLMFQLGILNEDGVVGDLLPTLGEGQFLLREEQVPTGWETLNGTKVTGRPDGVICEGSPEAPVFQQLLEIKSIASVYVALQVLYEEPKLVHLIQCAHYMHHLGRQQGGGPIPGSLIYRQYSFQEVPEFKHSRCPAQGSPGSEHIEYNRDGRPGKIRPFEVVFDLHISEDGTLLYRRSGSLIWVESIVTTADITMFYEFVSTMGEKKELGPRPLTIDTGGEEKSYSRCKYCPLWDVCKGRTAPTYDEWLAGAKEIAQAAIDRTAKK